MAPIDDVLPRDDAHELHSVASDRSVGDVLATAVAADAAAHRAFLRYWRVVGPFSALIRRRWLKQIAG